MKGIRYFIIKIIQSFTLRIKLKGINKLMSYVDRYLFRSNEIYTVYNNLPIQINHTVPFHTRNVIHYMGYEEVKVFEKFLKKGDVYVDVGGNLGYLSLNAEKIVGNKGQVVALEPDKTILPLLQKNIALNNSSIIVVEKAASFKRGRVIFNIATESGLSRMENKRQNSVGMELLEKKEVDMDSLDNIMANTLPNRKIDFIKIDVEGHEMNVLKGATKILEKDGPTLILEVNHTALKQNDVSLIDLIDFLKKFNYKFYRINAHGDAWLRIGREPTYTPIKEDIQPFMHKQFDILCVNPKSSPEELALEIEL